MESYFIIDIETCPLDLDAYEKLEEEERLKLINPIDSKVVAIGIRHQSQTKIFMSEDERKILTEFWNEWRTVRQQNPNHRVVGFNLVNFDISFLVSRSFINKVEIVPFTLKSLIDIREKINAYRYGKSKGRLSDFGKLMGLEVSNTNGSQVAHLWKEKKLDTLKAYLENDLELTEAMFKRVQETKILHIEKW